MIKLRHVPFFSDEWLVGTATMPVADVGVYIQAVALIYSHGGEVERDELRRIVRCRKQVFDASLGRLLAAGKLTLHGTRLRSERCTTTIRTCHERVLKLTDNGRKGGRPPNDINNLPKPNGSYARAKGNQELKERVLESKIQDSVAPLPRASAHEGGPSTLGSEAPARDVPEAAVPADAGAPAPTDIDPPDREQRDADEQDALTPEERAERVAILDAVLEGLRGGTPVAVHVRDPAAHRQAVTDHKRDAWLRDLHQWASGRLDGAQRMQAWEAIDCAIAAGSRDATPRHVRKHLDRLDRYRKSETSQLRGAA